MEFTGRVTRLDGRWAEVSVAPLAGCASCGKCNLGQAPRLRAVRALNQAQAEVGASVIVSMAPSGVIAASAWLYLLPLALLISGLALGNQYYGNVGALGLGAAFLLLALLLLRAGDSYWQRRPGSIMATIVEKCTI